MPAQPKVILETILGTLGFTATVEEHTLAGDLTLDVKTEESGRRIGRPDARCENRRVRPADWPAGPDAGGFAIPREPHFIPARSKCAQGDARRGRLSFAG